MEKYHKIQTVFKRDSATKFKTLLVGRFTYPEFVYLADNEWVFTEKVDGTNIRVLPNRYAPPTFKGKTDNSDLPGTLFEKLTELFYPKADKMQTMFGENTRQVCLYGEGYGPKIQKGGGNYGAEQDFVLFDVLVGNLWLTRDSVFDIAGKLGIKAVPIVGRGTLYDMVEKAKQGFKSTWGDFLAEGYVARPLVEMRRRNGERIITKIKHKDFANATLFK